MSIYFDENDFTCETWAGQTFRTSRNVDEDGYHLVRIGATDDVLIHKDELIRFANFLLTAHAADDHFIRFYANMHTIQHPLLCRPNLFTCPVGHAVVDAVSLLEENDITIVGYQMSCAGILVNSVTYKCSLSADNKLVLGALIETDI